MSETVRIVPIEVLILQNQEKIMSNIADLTAAVSSLAAAVTAVVQVNNTLESRTVLTATDQTALDSAVAAVLHATSQLVGVAPAPAEPAAAPVGSASVEEAAPESVVSGT